MTLPEETYPTFVPLVEDGSGGDDPTVVIQHAESSGFGPLVDLSYQTDWAIFGVQLTQAQAIAIGNALLAYGTDPEYKP